MSLAAARAADILAQLSDPTRLRAFAELAHRGQEGATLAELSYALDLPRATTGDACARLVGLGVASGTGDGVYRARPDAHAVFHTHPKWSTFLTMTGTPYKPVYAQGVLVGDIPLMDSPMSVNTRPMGEKMAAMLGKNPALLLKAHGVVVAGTDILEAFALAAYGLRVGVLA